MADRHLYEVRDGLYNLIDNAVDVRQLCDNCETVLTVLEHTVGLWVHSRYAYKAVEVCDRANRAVQHYSETCQHHKTHERLGKLRGRLSMMADRYHKAKYQAEQETLELHSMLGVPCMSDAELSA